MLGDTLQRSTSHKRGAWVHREVTTTRYLKQIKQLTVPYVNLQVDLKRQTVDILYLQLTKNYGIFLRNKNTHIIADLWL